MGFNSAFRGLMGVLFFFFADLKKQFDSPPYSQTVEMDRQTEVRCHPPPGVPPPRVYWLRNGVPLETDTNLIVSSEGHLLVGQARLQDTANYTCVAENVAARRVSEPALLTVYGEYDSRKMF
jgi:leucine-rich repeat transmembrane protein FLRT